MAAKRIATSAINWTAFSKLVPANQNEFYRAFKAHAESFVSKYVDEYWAILRHAIGQGRGSNHKHSRILCVDRSLAMSCACVSKY